MAELMYRGVDASDMELRWVSAYLEHRDTFMEWRKQVWLEAASELFDG